MSNPADNPFLEWVRRYAHDSVLFVREVFGVDPDDWQEKVMREYDRRERFISIVSGHGVGKSTLLAWLAVHQLLFRFPQKTLATAPTEAQLFDVLVADMKAWIKKLPQPIQDLFDTQAERISLKASPEESFFRARTARPDRPEAIQGVRSENTLILCDEASGIDDAIFRAGAGSMSMENATTILTGNPLRLTGLFWESQHRLKRQGPEDTRAGTWLTFHISSKDSPRVSREFIREIAEKYGEESNEYRIRILGEFPVDEAEVIIPRSLVASAVGRDVRPLSVEREIWGLDVAGSGEDRTVLARRKGKALIEKPRAWRGLEPMQIVGKIKELWDSIHPNERPIGIYADAIIHGGGVAQRLAELGLPAFPLNVSEMPAIHPELYKNIRTQLWFAAREWFQARDCRLPPGCDTMVEELSKQPYKVIDSSGKKLATPKKLVKKDLGRSPDEADAFIYTFAHGVAGGGSNWNEPLRRKITTV